MLDWKSKFDIEPHLRHVMIVVLCLTGWSLNAQGENPSKLVYGVLVDGRPVHSDWICKVGPSTIQSASKTEMIVGTYRVNDTTLEADSFMVYVCSRASQKRYANLYIPIPKALVQGKEVTLRIVANSIKRGSTKRQRLYNIDIYAFTAQGTTHHKATAAAPLSTSKALAKTRKFLVTEGLCDTDNLKCPVSAVHCGHRIPVPNDTALLKHVGVAIELYKQVYPDNTLRYIEIQENSPQRISLNCRSYWDSFSQRYGLAPEHKSWFEFGGCIVMSEQAENVCADWEPLVLETSDLPCQELTVNIDLRSNRTTYVRYNYQCMGKQSDQVLGERIEKIYPNQLVFAHQIHMDGCLVDSSSVITASDSCFIVARTSVEGETGCVELLIPIGSANLKDTWQRELVVVAESQSISSRVQRKLRTGHQRLYNVTLYTPTPHGLEERRLKVKASILE